MEIFEGTYKGHPIKLKKVPKKYCIICKKVYDLEDECCGEDMKVFVEAR